MNTRPGVGISENLSANRYPSVPKIFFWPVPGTHRYPKSFFWLVPGTHRYPKKIFWLVPGTHRYPQFFSWPVPGTHRNPKIFLWLFARYPVPSGTKIFKISMGTGVPLAPTPALDQVSWTGPELSF